MTLKKDGLRISKPGHDPDDRVRCLVDRHEVFVGVVALREGELNRIQQILRAYQPSRAVRPVALSCNAARSARKASGVRSGTPDQTS